jgi:hypothetical protein
MKLQVMIRTLLMAVAGGVLYALGRPTAALVVWSLAVFFTALAVLAPSIHATLDALIARAVARIMSGIGLAILVLVYGLIFVPGRLLLRLRRVDPMNRRFPAGGRSNWIERTDRQGDPEMYTRQYTRPHAGADGVPDR